MVGRVGDAANQLTPVVYADADFAGCDQTERPTPEFIWPLKDLTRGFPYPLAPSDKDASPAPLRQQNWSRATQPTNRT